MGIHMCEYCFDYQKGSLIPTDKVNRFGISSSGDVTLIFENGHAYELPDMLPHYAWDHNYRPPEDFIYDVMNVRYVGGERRQTRSAVKPTPIGYLHGEFPTGTLPEGFIEKLEELMNLADKDGWRLQTKGINNLR